MYHPVGDDGIPSQDASAAQGGGALVIDRDHNLAAAQRGIDLVVLEQRGVGKVVDQDVPSDEGGELVVGEGLALEGVVVRGEDRDGAATCVQLGEDARLVERVEEGADAKEGERLGSGLGQGRESVLFGLLNATAGRE